MEKPLHSLSLKTNALTKEDWDAKKRLLLKKRTIVLSPTDFGALVFNFVKAARDPAIGFEHVSTDLFGWFKALAPSGVELDEAFVEDMLCASNFLYEKKKFEHPTNKSFDQMVQDVIGRNKKFNTYSNTIEDK